MFLLLKPISICLIVEIILPVQAKIPKPSEKRERRRDISVENKSKETPAIERASSQNNKYSKEIKQKNHACNVVTLQQTDEKYIEVEKAFQQSSNISPIHIVKVILWVFLLATNNG